MGVWRSGILDRCDERPSFEFEICSCTGTVEFARWSLLDGGMKREMVTEVQCKAVPRLRTSHRTGELSLSVPFNLRWHGRWGR